MGGCPFSGYDHTPHPMDRLRQEGLGPVRRPPDGIVHCPDCGAYLGDYVNGILYKFGQEVTEPHTCKKR